MLSAACRTTPDLQYTATPQAPLLINIVDVLSPNFAEVLTPGEGYVGGCRLFREHPNLVCQIPQQQVPLKIHHQMPSLQRLYWKLCNFSLLVLR